MHFTLDQLILHHDIYQQFYCKFNALTFLSIKNIVCDVIYIYTGWPKKNHYSTCTMYNITHAADLNMQL